jgi:flagellar protein FliS
MDAGLSYREASAAGSNPVRLVILLYEQIIRDLRSAVDALKKGDIEARTREINHALQVIAHLRCTLDMERGRNVASNLERFYRHLSCALVDANCKQSEGMLEQQIALVNQIHEAWCAVERSVAAEGRVAEPRDSSQVSCDWKA